MKNSENLKQKNNAEKVITSIKFEIEEWDGQRMDEEKGVWKWIDRHHRGIMVILVFLIFVSVYAIFMLEQQRSSQEEKAAHCFSVANYVYFGSYYPELERLSEEERHDVALYYYISCLQGKHSVMVEQYQLPE